MSSSVKMLEAQRQEAKTQARLVNEKLRAQRNLVKCRKGREETKSNRLRKVGFRILALAQEAQKTLDRWLSVKLPELQADDRYKLMEEIVDEFISLDIDNIVGMLEPIARSDTRLLEEAKAAISSCDLHSWVCQQNIRKGLAPTVGAMVRKRQRLSEQAGGPTSDEAVTRKGRWGSYKWISRWRKKLGMPKGKIQDRDAPTPSEMTEKVRVVQLSSKPNISQCLTRMRTQFRGLILDPILDPNPDPISGLKKGPPWFQILEKRGAEIWTLFGGHHNQSNTKLGVQKRHLFFKKRFQNSSLARTTPDTVSVTFLYFSIWEPIAPDDL